MPGANLTAEWQATQEKMWRSFYATCSKSKLLLCKPQARAKCVENVVPSTILWKSGTWPIQKSLIRQMDIQQRKMYASVLAIKRYAGEDDQTYAHRKGRAASQYMDSMGKWSQRYCDRAIKYYEHCKRAHDPYALTPYVLALLPAQELQALRVANNSGNTTAGQLHLRTQRGQPASRFEESIIAAIDEQIL